MDIEKEAEEIIKIHQLHINEDVNHELFIGDLIDLIQKARCNGVKSFYSTFHPSRVYEGCEIRTMAANFVSVNGGDSSDMSSGFNL